MFRSYWKVASRTLLRNRTYSLINVAGLSLGIAASVVIFLIVRNELSYDGFHSKSDRTYRVTVNGLDYNPSVSFAVAPAFRNDFPEAEHVSQFFYRYNGLVKVDGNLYNEEGFAFADDQFTQIFDFAWLYGNPVTALKEPNSVVLTESIAKKYFGTTDVAGRIIRLDNKYDLQVTGVIEDLPSNTHLNFIFLISWATVDKAFSTSHFWSIAGGYLYVTLPSAASAERVAERFPAFITKNWGENIQKEATLILQPIREIHFDLRYIAQVSMPRSKDTVYGLAGVALFILLTACINFVNIASSQSMKRSREVGVRKSLGALRKQLIVQGLFETSVLVLVAVCLALAAVWSFLPYTKSLFNIRIDADVLLSASVMLPLAAVTASTILLAGLYPALVQSGFRPVDALKSGYAILPTERRPYLRKGLIVVQFAITQVLLVGTIVVGDQMDFFLNRNMGFTKDAVVTFPGGNNRDVLKQRLVEMEGVQDVSFSSGAPSYNTSFAPFSCPERGMTEVDVTELKFIDEKYMPMFSLELLAGKPVTVSREEDSVVYVAVNETLIKRLGIDHAEDAIGQSILIGRDPVFINGVIADFQSESKHKKIRSCIMLYNPKRFWQVSVRLDPRGVRESLATIEAAWSELNPESLFSYEFIDDHIAKLYRQEQQMFNAISLFSGIAIVIGCMGLFGLVSLIGSQRTKEIGIRKVLGASVTSIVVLFLRQFTWLIVAAFVLAAPLSWMAMNRWLEKFAYHIDIRPGILMVSLAGTFVVACLTIGYQSLKAALADPVRCLRSE